MYKQDEDLKHIPTVAWIAIPLVTTIWAAKLKILAYFFGLPAIAGIVRFVLFKFYETDDCTVGIWDWAVPSILTIITLGFYWGSKALNCKSGKEPTVSGRGIAVLHDSFMMGRLSLTFKRPFSKLLYNTPEPIVAMKLQEVEPRKYPEPIVLRLQLEKADEHVAITGVSVGFYSDHFQEVYALERLGVLFACVRNSQVVIMNALDQQTFLTHLRSVAESIGGTSAMQNVLISFTVPSSTDPALATFKYGLLGAVAVSLVDSMKNKQIREFVNSEFRDQVTGQGFADIVSSLGWKLEIVSVQD